MKIIPVEKESLVRDSNTGAILETDISKLHKHRAIRNKIAEKEDKIDILIDRINKLETLINGMTHGKLNT
jgi:hypothetical protein